MSSYGMELRAKLFLEDHPECREALRYLLSSPARCIPLQGLCSRFHISMDIWRRCYNRFGPRNGLGWIATIGWQSGNHTHLIQVVPDADNVRKMQKMMEEPDDI